MKRSFFTAIAMTFTLFSSIAAAGDVLTPSKDKKIVEFGWDNPTPEYLDRNLEEIETYVPHDGMGIDVSKTITLPNGKKIRNGYYNFTKIPYRREWYKDDIAHLKKVHARAKHLKYNFINTAASSFTGEFDLFDDKFWDIVCDKFAIFAWVAKQGGCAGIRFDLEDYGNQALWSYRPSCGHSFREAWEKARSRGRQWMNAITKEYPDITLFCFFWLDLMMGYGDDSPMRFEQLKSCPTGLLAAFINGIYDALPPGAKIVDGMEPYGYGAHTLSDYLRMRALREERFPKLLTAENRLKFLTQSSFACATYMDAYIAETGSFQKYRKNENMTMSGFFRRNFTWAVQYSDEYVWTWTECRKWFPCEYRHAWQKSFLKRSPTVPGPYVGMAIPGVEDAISYARDPWKYAFNFLKESKNLKNLLKNPDFEGSDGKSVLKPAPDSVFYKELPNWSTWQAKRSKGTFSLAAGQGIGGSNAILLKGVIGGCAHQGIKIDPNGAYIIRASAKIINKCGASLGAQWRDPKGKWCNHSLNMAVPFTEDLGNGWKRATLVIRNIPEKTQYLNVMLNSRAGNAEDAVLFDNVEVFSMFEKELAVAPHLKDALEKWRKNFAAKQKAEVLKNEKKSPPVPGNRVVNGGFQRRGEAVTGHILPEGALFKPAWEADRQKSKSRFFAVAGKGAGYADDSAAAIVGGDGRFVFHVTGTKPGQKYRVRAKARVVGAGKPVLKIYWSSPRSKGPFDFKMGISTFAFSKNAENSWMFTEGEITVPEGATKFALIPTATGLKTGKDYILFDDLEAVLIP